MMSLKRYIPNILTCCNLFCGLLAIALVSSRELSNDIFQYFSANAGQSEAALRSTHSLVTAVQSFSLNTALVLLLVAFVFDFLDGLVARNMKVQSAVGRDLDSLSDLVSFGVAPAAMALKSLAWLPINALLLITCAGMFLLPVFTALRLAKFNNDSRQKVDFIGLPASASGLLVASAVCLLSALMECQGASENMRQDSAFQVTDSVLYSLPLILLVVALLSGFLMLSNIRFFSFKDSSKLLSGWTKQKIMIGVIDIAIIIYLLTDVSLSLCLLCVLLVYIIMCVARNIFKVKE